MLTKITTLVALNMLYAQAVVTPGVVIGGTAALPTGYPLATTALTGAAITAYTATIWYGGYLCIRQGDNWTYPGINAAGQAMVAAASATMMNYYPTTVAQVGIQQAAVIGENAGFSACTTASTAVADNATAYVAAGIIANRVVFKANAAYANNIATLNIDFVLAATYQVGWQTADATRPAAAYCDKQITALTATAVTLSTFGVAFLGGTKCTYILTVAATGGAPSFAVSALGFNAFQLHYAEWSSTDMAGQSFLATGAYTGTVAAASTYPSVFQAVYPASATGTADLKLVWPQAAEVASHTNWFPASNQVGSVGTFSWYPAAAGPFQSTTVGTMDSATLIGMLDATTASYASYNSAKSTYDTAKTAYNTALAAEKARVADFFKAMFDPAVTIPARPCQPTMPAAYMGPNVDITLTTGAYTTINATSKVLGYGAFARNAVATPTLNSGFLSSTPDSTATTPLFTWTGHVFGLYGQGAATMPADGIAYPSRIIPTGETHGMMVSIFPDVMSQAAGTTTAKVDFSVKTVSWRVVTTIEAPAAPAASVAPDSAAAAYLAAGAAAIAAVAATLF